MLKRFFISLLGTVAGIWISFFLIVFGGLMLVGMFAGSESDEGIKKNSILYLDLSGAIEERAVKPSVSDLMQGNVSDAPTLREIIEALRLASTDNRIDGVVLDCKGASMGFATCEELVNALGIFTPDKWVYAYSDGYEQGDYLLAAARADSIFMNPLGGVNLHGVASQIPFFKGLLDKVGVKMQIVKVGSFKSAVEPYILTSASEPSRLQTQTFVDSIWGYMRGVIAGRRNMSQEKVTELASEFLVARGAEAAVKGGLVDRLIYRREFEDMLRSLTNLDRDEELRYVTPARLLGEKTEADPAAILKAMKGGKNKPDKVLRGEHLAVLYATGDITDDSGNGIVGSEMVPQIVKLADDDDVLGLLLRVNSGGGSAFASEQIWEALEYFKSKGKPFYVSMGDYAASGGYYISCGADRIFADETTLTGSIGVFGMIPDASGLITGKLGVNFSAIESNSNALPPSMVSPLTHEQSSALQESVEHTYDLFTKRVAQGRGMSQEDVKKIAEGRVWVGTSALQLGLVDELGSLVLAESAIKNQLGDLAIKTVYYPEAEDDFLTMLVRSGAFDDVKAQCSREEFDAETRALLEYVNRLRMQSPIQARMELYLFN
ncbi:MAG: signal peptide peptidase SppA [Muribaculaceae bacterium]|nr:signal peptide peptidase SppA [Muribaculaceae bacterium]